MSTHFQVIALMNTMCLIDVKFGFELASIVETKGDYSIFQCMALSIEKSIEPY